VAEETKIAEEQPSEWATVDEARADHAILHDAWWKAYCERGPGRSDEKIAMAKASLDACAAKVLEKFGRKNPAHPDCEACLRASVFGGPSHEPSRMCRSGKRPHCSCDACF
jgi:hypothetical protein